MERRDLRKVGASEADGRMCARTCDGSVTEVKFSRVLGPDNFWQQIRPWNSIFQCTQSDSKAVTGDILGSFPGVMAVQAG